MSTNKKSAVKTAPKKMIVLHHTANPAAVKVELPKSHAFARTLVCLKTRILISISALPANDKRIKSSEAAVFLHTLIGNVGYQEKVEFENITRALEYVADFSQIQSARFANAAIVYYKQHDPELNPPMQMTTNEPGQDTKKG